MKYLSVPERVIIAVIALVIALAVTAVVFMRAYILRSEGQESDAMLNLAFDECSYFDEEWSVLA